MSNERQGPDRELADEELVAIAQRSRETPEGRRAIAELFGRYHRRVYLWCYRRVRDHELARDLGQDALLSAWRALPSFEGRSRFSSWLYAIARNRALNALKAAKLPMDVEADLDDVLDPAETPDAALALRDGEARLLARMRERLTPTEQEALWLSAVERWPVAEITRALGITGASGARGVLQSARRKLRAALGRGLEREES